MWTCPVCNRSFRNKNQDHSCEKSDPARHFLNKDPVVIELFEKLLGEVTQFGDVKLNSVKNALLFTRSTNFLALKPKKKWMDIEFVLDHEVDEFPVHKTVKTSKNKWAHFVRLGSVDEIDETLVSWLRRAHEVSK